MRGNTPIAWARNLFTGNPDQQREAIFKLADRKFGRQDPYRKHYGQLAESDADFTVRAAAIRALNRARDHQDVPVYIKAMDDANELVRLEAAKALANIPDERAVPVLIKHLDRVAESRDVRIAAADALRNFHSGDAAQALIRVLQDRDFGVSWQARRSLNLLTGQDYRYNQSAWLAYVTSTTKPFG